MFAILAVAYVAVSGPAPALPRGTDARSSPRAARAGARPRGRRAGRRRGAPVAALLPGLVLVGAGIGLCFTPLTSMVLAGSTRHARAPRPAPVDTQQVGYALGVAVTGSSTSAPPMWATAFELSLVELAALAAGIVAMTRLLPRPAGETAGAAVPAPA